MKRNSVTKKILSALMCLLMIVSVVPLGVINASAADMDTRYYQPGIWHELNFKWKNDEVTTWKDNNEYNLGLHSYNGKLAYCIEPGSDVDNKTDEFYSFSDSRFHNATRGVLSNEQIEELVKLVVANGYPTGVSMPKVEGNTLVPKDTTFHKAFATQLLIWEIVTGERNSDFSYNGEERFALKYIKTSDAKDAPYLKSIKDEYDRIANAVSADAVARKQTDTNVTYDEKYFDLGTVELKLNTSNFCYEGVFSNENIKNCSVSSLDTLPQKYLSIDHNNGTLKISIPIKEAFAYQKQTYTGELKKTVTTTSSESFSYKDISSMGTTIYKGGQQMVVFVGDPNTITKTITHTYNTPYRLSFAIKVPEVHRHNWIPHKINPTCTTQGLMCWECSCGKVITSNYTFTYGTSDPTDYDFKTGIVDAENHDSGVAVTTVEPTCTTKGETKTLCTKCGVVIGTNELKELGHTKEGEGSVWVVTQEPTAEAKGEMSLCCGRCGAVQKTKEIAQHTHDDKGGEVVITAPTCSVAGKKGTLCSACGAVYNTETIPACHSDETVEITNVAATCTEDGEATILCTDCGEILSTKVLPALGHTDDDVWYTAVEPTCTVGGEARKMCTRCGEVTDSKSVDALGHDEGVWTTSIEPTCELDGEKVLTCTRCGKVEDSKTIAKLGHDDGAWRIDIEATADHDGSMNLYCTRCGMVKETKAFQQHEHKNGYTKTLLQPTCTRDGEKGTVCEICNAIYETEKIVAAGHSYLAPYKNGNGTHSKKCENCNYVYTENCSVTTTDYANSCTNIGYSVHTCSLCGYSYTDGYKEAKGHDYSKWENYNSTSHVRYCSRCPVAEYTIHVWSPYYFNGDNTSTDPGTKTKTCIYCGITHTIKADDNCETTINKVADSSLEISIKILSILNFIPKLLETIINTIAYFLKG
ncbi:MAG: thioester domain-containing protein [Acutalibacteraceae bacterium]